MKVRGPQRPQKYLSLIPKQVPVKAKEQNEPKVVPLTSVQLSWLDADPGLS